MGELLPVPAPVAEKDDVRGREAEMLTLVLGIEEPPSLQALCHRIEMR